MWGRGCVSAPWTRAATKMTIAHVKTVAYVTRRGVLIIAIAIMKTRTIAATSLGWMFFFGMGFFHKNQAPNAFHSGGSRKSVVLECSICGVLACNSNSYSSSARL